MLARTDHCPNFNHGRSNAPVRFCSMCGDAVNDKISTKKCSEEKHDKSRRNRDKYCVDCGKQLIPGD